VVRTTTTVAVIAKRSQTSIAISKHQRMRVSVFTFVGELVRFCCCSNKLPDMDETPLYWIPSSFLYKEYGAFFDDLTRFLGGIIKLVLKKVGNVVLKGG